MSIYVGKDKATLFHGDHHPASLYKGDKLIAGFEKPTLTGKDQISFQSPYKANMDSVKAYGWGEQEKLEGTNLFNPKVIPGFISGIKPGDDIVIGPNPAFPKAVMTEPISIEVAHAVSWKLKGLSSEDLRNIRVRFWNDTTMKCTYPYLSAGEVVNLNLPDDTTKVAFVFLYGKAPSSLSQFNISSSLLSYEPYCGGIPAPNPDYPIEPRFFPGGELSVGGKNLCDPQKCKFKNRQNIYAYAKHDGFDGFTLEADLSYTFSVFNTEPVTAMYFDDWEKNTTIATAYNTDHITYTPSKDVKVNLLVYNISGISEDIQLQFEISPTPTPYEPYYPPQLAQIPVLRALPDGSVRDEYDVRTGVLTRRIGEYRFIGTEAWKINKVYQNTYMIAPVYADPPALPYSAVLSNKFFNYPNLQYDNCVRIGSFINFHYSKAKGVEEWRKYLADQKAAGTPVTIWYALETPIIEHLPPKLLTQHPGTTVITQIPKEGTIYADMSAKVYKEDNNGK